MSFLAMRAKGRRGYSESWRRFNPRVAAALRARVLARQKLPI
jgi:hypothetical protein